MTSSDLPEKNPAQWDELRRQLAALKAELTSQQWLLEALESQAAQYRALFELMPGSVVVLDAKGYIRDANPYFCRAMCYSREELIGLHVTQISHEKPEAIERNILRMIAGETLEHEVTNVQKDGSLRFYELREAVVTFPDGSMNILAVSNDVTDRKRAGQAKLEMERQLLHAQKLDSLGALAGGVAHDFNNLLAVILSNIELAISDVPTTSPAQNYLTNALLAGKRAAELTRQMLAYSGRGRFLTTEIDLSRLVQEMSDLLRVSVSKSVRLELNLASDLPLIRAEAAQVQQILMNLVMNSSEAVGDKPGVLTITTSVRDCDTAFLAETRTINRPVPGRYVILEVSDTGCGMDDLVRANLFDPFFTTKLLGRGLGMSAVLGIVQGHRGAIMVSSKPRKGTIVSVLFPVNTPLPTASVVRHPVSPAGKMSTAPLSGTVLVADDENQVRSLMELLLRRMGLRVLAASDGAQAVELFQQNAEDITFVLIDLSMPKLDGRKALAEMRRIRPNVKVVLTSGYDSEDLTNQFSHQGFDAFIQKPCDVETFRSIVRQMCG